MNMFGVRIGLSDGELERLLDRARAAHPTYAHVGSTLDVSSAASRLARTHHLDVGGGDVDFAAAVGALRSWVPQRGIGADIVPDGQAVVLGATVLVVLRRGPARVVAPNRVVAVIDDPCRFAFAYGTLPGHPESGEESFMVELLPDGVVRATIRVDAVPATVPARVVAPLVRRLQTTALRGYLDAIARHVAGPG